MSRESPRASTSLDVSRTTAPPATSPVKYEVRGSSTKIRLPILSRPPPSTSPDEEPRPAVRARRDPEPVHVHGRGPAVRAAQGDRTPGPGGDHRLLDRGWGREVRPPEPAHRRDDHDDDDHDQEGAHGGEQPQERAPADAPEDAEHRQGPDDDDDEDDDDDRDRELVLRGPAGRRPGRGGSLRVAARRRGGGRR